jgi:hypothetical protein
MMIPLRTAVALALMASACAGAGPGAEGAPADGGAADASADAAPATTAAPTTGAASDASATRDGTATADAAPLPAAPRGDPGPAPPAPWRAQDIGDAVIAQGLSMSGPNAFYYRFGGREIGGTADSFYFAYQPVKGDFEFFIKIGSILGDPTAQVGVMARASLQPGSPHVTLAVLAGDGAGGQFLVRSAQGGMTSVQAQASVKPSWLRLVRSGKTITAFRSDSNAPGSWTRVASADLDLPVEMFVGTAMAARAGREAGGVELDDCLLNNLAADPATAGWLHDDIGAVGGTVMYGDGKFAVSGWGEPPTAKILRFTIGFRTPAGNQRVTARFLGQSSTASSTRAGVMVRDTGIGLGAGSAASRRGPSNASGWVYVAGDKTVYFQHKGGSEIVTAGMVRDLVPPFWIRVEKQDVGDLVKISGLYSRDGQQWTIIGTGMEKFDYKVSFVAGLFSSSGDYAAMDTASFDNVSVQPLP